MTTKKDLLWDEFSQTISVNRELISEANEIEIDELIEEIQEKIREIKDKNV